MVIKLSKIGRRKDEKRIKIVQIKFNWLTYKRIKYKEKRRKYIKKIKMNALVAHVHWRNKCDAPTTAHVRLGIVRSNGKE